MRLRRNTFAAATWSESEIVRCFAAAAGAVMVAADGLSRPLEGRQAIKYVGAGEADHMIVPGTQRFMAERMKAQVRSYPVDHTPSVTAPNAVVDVILDALRSTAQTN